MTIHWTERAQDDLAAIHAFIEADSADYAAVTVRQRATWAIVHCVRDCSPTEVEKRTASNG